MNKNYAMGWMLGGFCGVLLTWYLSLYNLQSLGIFFYVIIFTLVIMISEFIDKIKEDNQK